MFNGLKVSSRHSETYHFKITFVRNFVWNKKEKYCFGKQKETSDEVKLITINNWNWTKLKWNSIFVTCSTFHSCIQKKVTHYWSCMSSHLVTSCRHRDLWFVVFRTFLFCSEHKFAKHCGSLARLYPNLRRLWRMHYPASFIGDGGRVSVGRVRRKAQGPTWFTTKLLYLHQ